MVDGYGPAVQQSPAENVVEAVATHTGTDPLELPPLQAVLDTDALNAVVRRLREGEVTFEYAETTVTIHSDGTVDVAARPQADCAGRAGSRAD